MEGDYENSLDAVVNKIMALCRATASRSNTPKVEVAPDTIQGQLKQLRQQLAKESELTAKLAAKESELTTALAAKDEEIKALREQLLRLFPSLP